MTLLSKAVPAALSKCPEAAMLEFRAWLLNDPLSRNTSAALSDWLVEAVNGELDRRRAKRPVRPGGPSELEALSGADLAQALALSSCLVDGAKNDALRTWLYLLHKAVIAAVGLRLLESDNLRASRN